MNIKKLLTPVLALLVLLMASVSPRSANAADEYYATLAPCYGWCSYWGCGRCNYRLENISSSAAVCIMHTGPNDYYLHYNDRALTTRTGTTRPLGATTSMRLRGWWTHGTNDAFGSLSMSAWWTAFYIDMGCGNSNTPSVGLEPIKSGVGEWPGGALPTTPRPFLRVTWPGSILTSASYNFIHQSADPSVYPKISEPAWRKNDMSSGGGYPVSSTAALPSAGLDVGVFYLHTPYDSSAPNSKFMEDSTLLFQDGWKTQGSEILNGGYITVVLGSPLTVSGSPFGLSGEDITNPANNFDYQTADGDIMDQGMVQGEFINYYSGTTPYSMLISEFPSFRKLGATTNCSTLAENGDISVSLACDDGWDHEVTSWLQGNDTTFCPGDILTVSTANSQALGSNTTLFVAVANNVGNTAGYMTHIGLRSNVYYAEYLLGLYNSRMPIVTPIAEVVDYPFTRTVTFSAELKNMLNANLGYADIICVHGIAHNQNNLGWWNYGDSLCDGDLVCVDLLTTQTNELSNAVILTTPYGTAYGDTCSGTALTEFTAVLPTQSAPSWTWDCPGGGSGEGDLVSSKVEGDRYEPNAELNKVVRYQNYLNKQAEKQAAIAAKKNRPPRKYINNRNEEVDIKKLLRDLATNSPSLKRP